MAIKKRTTKPTFASTDLVKEKQIEAFAAAADGGDTKEISPTPTLDPNAPRKFKGISIHFNEYEFQQLEALSQATGRSKLNTIRYALRLLSEENEAN